jgi:ribosomal-protein-alanine N-acetyltransferase
LTALRARRRPAPASSSVVAGVCALQPMTTAQLDAVMAIEVSAYPFPWTRGNFIDSLAAGHPAWLLQDRSGGLLGYFVAMTGVEEMHLLNITVAPAAQRQGHARVLMAALVSQARDGGAHQLWLEVRLGNAAARAVYARLGFVQVGVRKGYYPAGFGRREDAIVMSLLIEAAETPEAPDAEAGDALG